jgi:hypothetical protein
MLIEKAERSRHAKLLAALFILYGAVGEHPDGNQNCKIDAV